MRRCGTVVFVALMLFSMACRREFTVREADPLEYAADGITLSIHMLSNREIQRSIRDASVEVDDLPPQPPYVSILAYEIRFDREGDAVIAHPGEASFEYHRPDMEARAFSKESFMRSFPPGFYGSRPYALFFDVTIHSDEASSFVADDPARFSLHAGQHASGYFVIPAVPVTVTNIRSSVPLDIFTGRSKTPDRQALNTDMTLRMFEPL